jgi:hypothetical protein
MFRINMLSCRTGSQKDRFECVLFVQQSPENVRNGLCMRPFNIERQGTFGNLTVRRRGRPQVVLFGCLSGVSKESQAVRGE